MLPVENCLVWHFDFIFQQTQAHTTWVTQSHWRQIRCTRARASITVTATLKWISKWIKSNTTHLYSHSHEFLYLSADTDTDSWRLICMDAPRATDTLRKRDIYEEINRVQKWFIERYIKSRLAVVFSLFVLAFAEIWRLPHATCTHKFP